MGEPFFVYLLICADGAYYAGHTDDLGLAASRTSGGAASALCSTQSPRERCSGATIFTIKLEREEAP